MLKKILQTASIFYLILLIVIWFTPIAFAATEVNSFKSDLAYFVTNTGGVIWIVGITFVTASIFAFRSSIEIHFIIRLLKQFGILFFMLAFFALLNEFGIKGIAKFTRPSHAYVFEHSTSKSNITAFYKLAVIDRQSVLKKMIDENPYLQEHIDKKVLAHWIEEAGYSFPSGHSFNAFLLATVLAFSILRSRKLHLNKYFFVPFIWATAIAISRVAIGAHAPIDVTFGAAMGIFFAGLLLYFETSRNIILHRKHERGV